MKRRLIITAALFAALCAALCFAVPRVLEYRAAARGLEAELTAARGEYSELFLRRDGLLGESAALSEKLSKLNEEAEALKAEIAEAEASARKEREAAKAAAEESGFYTELYDGFVRDIEKLEGRIADGD